MDDSAEHAVADIYFQKKEGLIKSAPPFFDDLFITDHSWLIAYV